MKIFFLFLLMGGWLPVNAGTRLPHSFEKGKERLFVADTVPRQQTTVPDNKQDAPRQPVAKGKPIKEVPKAKNQAKPKMVTPASIKIKPVKIIKPKINGKGLGR
ncbi:hypothetical protein LQ567_22345 [Niabella pedocola]|uniref:Uncharacterized protein n=1 Tax=Niabella pedocola TaxID=1752077 RepID=A0ABS8Q034_9BACT|nr:hypothetical protein [Niabella pedocola]MCD2425541.1 hypothetical protein [Niabella pedocola]